MDSILITRRIPEAGIALLHQHFQIVEVNPHDRPLTHDELLASAKDKDGLLTMLNDRIDAAFLEQCPNLKAISQYAVGYNNIDIAACTARGIGVANTPGVLTNATAETAWALLFAVARRIVEAADYLKTGAWDGWAPLQFLGVDIIGKTLGVIGAGRIGQQFALMSRGFNMPVLYHQRSGNALIEKELGAKKVELDKLLSAADFIAIHVPLTPDTRRLINAQRLKLMNPSAILINTARGAIIDEQALLEALRAKQIRGAGLDVFEFEPKVTAGLLDFPNVVALPHIGSATVETRTQMSLMTAQALIDMLGGTRPQFPVNPTLWAPSGR